MKRDPASEMATSGHANWPGREYPIPAIAPDTRMGLQQGSTIESLNPKDRAVLKADFNLVDEHAMATL